MNCTAADCPVWKSRLSAGMLAELQRTQSSPVFSRCTLIPVVSHRSQHDKSLRNHRFFFIFVRKHISAHTLSDVSSRLCVAFRRCRCGSCVWLCWASARRWFVPMEECVRTETPAARTRWEDTAAARCHT